MHEEMKMEIEELHKEIDLVQGCINRMAQNSFHIKGWTVTIFAVVLALLPEKIAPTHAILAERCERFRYCCIVGCQNDKRRVETSGGATGVGGTNPGMPQQRSLRKRMVPAARCYNNTPGKFLRHPSFFCGSSNPAK